MKRFILGFVVLAAAACNKPELEDCRKALDNMQHLLGTDTISKNGDNEGDVRRCRGASTKESVACAIKAQTMDDLRKCGFMKHPAKADDSAGSGSDGK